MQQWKRALVACALVLAVGGLSTGCMRNSWKTDQKPVRASYTERNHHFLYGLVGHSKFNSDEFCPNGHIAEVGTKMTFGNWLAQTFTFNIWVPRKMSVTCGKGDTSADAGKSATVAAAEQQ